MVNVTLTDGPALVLLAWKQGDVAFVVKHTKNKKGLHLVGTDVVDTLVLDHDEEAFLWLYPVKRAVPSWTGKFRASSTLTSAALQPGDSSMVQ